MSLKKFFQREYPIAKQLGWIHLFYSVERIFNIKLHRNNNRIALKHHALVRSFLDKSFTPPNTQITPCKTTDYINFIWTLWLQGVEKAPSLVKKCIASIKKYANGHPVVIVTAENLHEYIEFPTYINEKYNQGIITNQNYSDLVRMYLLSHYGGLWCDATIFVTKNIPEYLFDYDFFSKKRPFDPKIRDFVPDGKWAAYLLASKPHNVVTSLEYQLFLQYWEKEDHLVDYYLVDYIMDYLYRHHTVCKEQIDAIPFNNQDIFYVVNHLNETADANRFDEILASNLFQKLSWRVTPNENPDTYYNRLIKLLD